MLRVIELNDIYGNNIRIGEEDGNKLVDITIQEEGDCYPANASCKLDKKNAIQLVKFLVDVYGIKE